MTGFDVNKITKVINNPLNEEKQVKNPMEQIEIDTRNLMKKCYTLSYEFETYKKKTETDKKQMILAFIGVSDDIEKILKNANLEADKTDEKTKDLVSKLQLVLKKLSRVLHECGAVPIQVSVGENIDPHFHNAIEFVEESGKENNTIVEEISKGYMLDNELLRVVDVKVIKNKEN